MANTKLLLQIFVVLYFFLPAPISEYIFNNEFYIYSENQHTGNIISVIAGAIVLVWLHYIFSYKFTERQAVAKKTLSRSAILANAYYLFLAYLASILLEGLRVRSGGASREQMLDLMDSLLLPGLGPLLLMATIFIVSQTKKRHIFIFSVLSLLVDIIYNGKIFSFLATVVLVFWLDLNIRPAKRARRIFFQIVAAGALIVAAMGVSRVLIAGEDIQYQTVSLVYTLGAEFLGVQASTGWSVGFFHSGNGITLWHFDTALQDFYLNSVGHGLATSTPAFFYGNFGELGLPLEAIALTAIGVILKSLRGTFRWIMLLIVCINFQNFLRHGFDVFIVKTATQAIFSKILLEIVLAKRQPRAKMELAI